MKDVKKGKMTKIEKCYIDNNATKLSVEELASDLERSEAFIQKYVDELKLSLQKEPTATDLLARKEGVVVMTREASEKGDENKKKVRSKKSSKLDGCIFRPNRK